MSNKNKLFKHDAVEKLIEDIREMYRSSTSDGENAIVSPEMLLNIYCDALAIHDNRVCLDLGIHHHRHGESYYVLETTEPATKDVFKNMLEEDFEPHLGETLEIVHNIA